MKRFVRMATWVASVALVGTLVGGNSAVFARSSRGGTIHTCLPGESPCVGTKRPDILTAAADGNDNLVDGGAGNDIVQGVGDGDTLIGGKGTDIIIVGDFDNFQANDKKRDMILCTADTDIEASTWDSKDVITGPCTEPQP